MSLPPATPPPSTQSERIRVGLAAAKARGLKLGNRTNLAKAAARGAAANRRQADERVARVLPFIREAQARGVTTLRGLAEELNRQAIPAAHGRAWHASTVRKVLIRARA